MVDADRLQIQAEGAEIRSEMARTRLRFALASRDALVRRRQEAEQRRQARVVSRDQPPRRPAAVAAGAAIPDAANDTFT